MRLTAPVTALVVALVAASLEGGVADAAERRTGTFTIEPAPSLPARPRQGVDVAPLKPPGGAGVPVMVDAGAPTAPTSDILLGRWTQGDLGYCEDDRYVVEWSDDAQLIRLDGRTLDRRRVRYAA